MLYLGKRAVLVKVTAILISVDICMLRAKACLGRHIKVFFAVRVLIGILHIVHVIEVLIAVFN